MSRQLSAAAVVTITALRGDAPYVQLTGALFRDEKNMPIAVKQITNPSGQSPETETPGNLLDPKSPGKWLDLRYVLPPPRGKKGGKKEKKEKKKKGKKRCILFFSSSFKPFLWVGFNISTSSLLRFASNGRKSALVFYFASPAHVASLELTSGNDEPARDPVTKKSKIKNNDKNKKGEKKERKKEEKKKE
jgi:hypothetical protein